MIEKSKVLEAANALNESKLAEKKIKTVATSVETLKEAFMEAVETISEKDEKKIPKAVAKMYNDLVEETESAADDNDDEESTDNAEEEEVVEKKGKGKKAKPEPEEEDDNDDEEEEEKPKAKVKNKKAKEEEPEEEDDNGDDSEPDDDEEEDEKPKKKVEKESKKKGMDFTRADAIVAIILKTKDSKKALSNTEIAEKADALFIQKGGGSNISGSRIYATVASKIFQSLKKNSII